MTVRNPPCEGSAQPASVVDPDAELEPTVCLQTQTLRIEEPDGPAAEHQVPERYDHEAALGTGGMGSVLLCRDRQIGRRVALKILRPKLAVHLESKMRFLREARIQGQLEHPALVPVYDLGANPDGTVYFTMKRVRGVTLRELLNELPRAGPELREKYSRRRLLTAFSSVCLAVDFVHQHGVLHRDLKPSNIMLGDFGEVYILDWGIAKLTGEPASEQTDLDQLSIEDLEPRDVDLRTATGDLVGSLGYMSPEQLRGGRRAVRPSVDIYSLGTVLFELLTHEQLHAAPTGKEKLASTIAGADARASVRAPLLEIPPELDAICVKATAVDPDERYASAREMHEAVERYLDGQRDEQLRKELAQKHARAAADAWRGARDGVDADEQARRRAMKHVGKALALDPANRTALRTMVRLLTQPPDELPNEVRRRLRRSSEGHWRWTGWVGGLAYLTFLLYVPLLLLAGVRQPLALVAYVVLAAASGLAGLGISRMRRPTSSVLLGTMMLSTLCFVSTMTFFGPLVLMPGIVAANTVGWAITMDGRPRLFAIAFGCLAVVVPALLELTGLTPASYAFTEAGMLIRPWAIGFPKGATVALLLTASIATVITASLSVTRVRDWLVRTEQQLHLQSWQIRQLAPTGDTDESTDA